MGPTNLVKPIKETVGPCKRGKKGEADLTTNVL